MRTLAFFLMAFTLVAAPCRFSAAEEEIPDWMLESFLEEIGGYDDHPYARLPPLRIESYEWLDRDAGGAGKLEVGYRNGAYAVIRITSDDIQEISLYLGGLLKVKSITSNARTAWFNALHIRNIRPLPPRFDEIIYGVSSRTFSYVLEYQDISYDGKQIQYGDLRWASSNVLRTDKINLTINGEKFLLSCFVFEIEFRTKGPIIGNQSTWRYAYVPMLGISLRESVLYSDFRVSRSVMNEIRNATLDNQ